MKSKLVIFLITSFILIIIGTVILITYLDREDEEVKGITKENFSYSGWIPDWGTDSGIESLNNNSELFSSISPVWYEINYDKKDGQIISDGSLKNKIPTEKEQMIKIAKENKYEVIPAIAMFDYRILASVFQNEESLNNHVNSIINEVAENNYDGIDLDYESTRLEDKDKYFIFLSRLSKGLHSIEKKLIVTVLPQWGEEKYTALPETRSVQDWRKIADLADKIRIMTYDYTYSKSSNPGPIAPLSWVREVLDYALSQADAEKFVLGIHLYSYEWSDESYRLESGETNSSLSFIEEMSKNGVGTKRATSYIFESVSKILDRNKGELSEYEGEKIYRYTKLNTGERSFEDRVLVFIDEKGVEERVKLAKEYGLKGAVFWRLGGEGSLLKNLN